MRVRFEKISELSENLIQFYTVRLGNNELTEFELFDEKVFPNHTHEVELAYNVILEIQRRGAYQHQFKPEHAANALPRVSQQDMDDNKDDFGLRLYCILLTRELVVLLNGGIKTKRNPEDCENVKDHFLRAKKIAVRLDKDFKNNEINYSDENPFEDYEIDI